MIEDKVIGGTVTIGKTGVYINAETNSGYILSFKFVSIPNLSTIGVSNITKDQMYVLFIDYDNIKYEDLKLQLNYISDGLYSEIPKISHFLILSTGENKYHVICFEKFKLEEIGKILDNTLSDYSYKKIPIKLDKGWILRIKPKIDLDGNIIKDKPELVTFIDYGYKNLFRSISRAHIELFKLLYPTLEIPQYIIYSMDNNEVVKILQYGTSNKDFMHNLGMDELINSKRLIIDWEVDNGKD